MKIYSSILLQLFCISLLTAQLQLVKDLNPGVAFSNPGPMISFDGVLYFGATDGTLGRELWKTDGTPEGTVLVKDIYSGVNQGFNTFSSPLIVGSEIYFVGITATTGRELWKTDGTTAGTQMIKDIRPGAGDALFVLPDWQLHDNYFFFADDGVNGTELWESDGTDAGTTLVKDIYAGPPSSTFLPEGSIFNSKIIFTASNLAHASEPWMSDGTTGGTDILLDLNPGMNVSSNPYQYFECGGILYFVSIEGPLGSELYKTDGTSGGTLIVRDINSGAPSSGPHPMGCLSGDLLFRANDGSDGWELWRTDGTSANTVLVKDINTGSDGSIENEPTFVVWNEDLYFMADNGIVGEELWKSDGTTQGTQLVKDIRPGSQSGGTAFLRSMEVAGEHLYFLGNDGIHGEELWVTDGTTAGTFMAADVYPGPTGSGISSLFANGDDLFIGAEHPDLGHELWKYSYEPPPAIYWTSSGTGKVMRNPKDNSVVDTLISGELFFYSSRRITIDTCNDLIFHANFHEIRTTNLDGDSLSGVIFQDGIQTIQDIQLDQKNKHLYVLLYQDNTVQSTIIRMNLDGSGQTTIHTSAVDKEITAIAVDPCGGKIYYARVDHDNENPDPEQIRRMNLNGTGIQDLLFADGVSSLAVDNTNNSFYYASGDIRKADLDGSNDQVAINLGGGLDGPDRITLDPAGGKIYWFISDFLGRYVMRANVDGSGIGVIVSPAPFDDLAIDEKRDKLYWTDILLPAFGRSDLDGSNQEELRPRPPIYVHRIEADLKNQHLYFTEDFVGNLFRSKLNGDSITNLIMGGLDADALAIDLREGKIYYVATEGSGTKLKRMNLDASNQEELINLGFNVNVGGLTIDIKTCRIYWTDTHNDHIVMTDLDGSNQQIIVTGLNNPQGISVDTLNEKIYWAANGAGMIQYADLDGQNVVDILPSVISPTDLVVDVQSLMVCWTNNGVDSLRCANLDGTNVHAIAEKSATHSYGITCGVKMPMTACMTCPTDTAYVHKIAVDTSIFNIIKIIADSLICTGLTVNFLPTECADLEEGFEVAMGSLLTVDIDPCQE